MNLSSRVVAGNYMDGLNFQESTCKQTLLGFRATDVRWYDPGCAPASLTTRIELLTLCTMDGMKFAVIAWDVRCKASSQAGWWVERCQRDGSLVTHNQMSYSRAMTWHLSAVLVPSLHGKPRELTREVFSISGDGLCVMEKTCHEDGGLNEKCLSGIWRLGFRFGGGYGEIIACWRKYIALRVHSLFHPTSSLLSLFHLCVLGCEFSVACSCPMPATCCHAFLP